MPKPRETTTLPPVKTYEIKVPGFFPPVLYHERTPARARANAWRDYGICEDCSFGDFLAKSSIRRVPNSPGIGARIIVAGVPAVRAGMQGQYVRFMRDDSDVALLSHPADVQPCQEQGHD